MPQLTAWANFYVIVGSSAGALIGLTFVVITLLAQIRQQEAELGVSAFTTPSVVHFGTALLLAALLSAPWPSLVPPAVLLGLCGLAGMPYTVIVMRRELRLETYHVITEDWLWYGACPFVAYAVLLAAAFLLPGSPAPVLFVIGGAMLLILFLGIHNAWDVVTYLVTVHMARQGEQTEQDETTE